MFVTSNKNIIYINTDSMNYGISPCESDEMIEYLVHMGFMDKNWHYSENKNVNFHRDKKFIIPFLDCSCNNYNNDIKPICFIFMQQVTFRSTA